MTSQTTSAPPKHSIEPEEPADHMLEEMPLWMLIADLLTLAALAAVFWYLLEIIFSTRRFPNVGGTSR